jgi:hypothetical protein
VRFAAGRSARKRHGIRRGEHRRTAGWERASCGWGRFLLPWSDAELQDAASRDPMIAQAVALLDALSADPDVQRMAAEREEAFLMCRFELGEARGEARGRAEGLERQRAMIERLLRTRFGEPTPASLDRVATASVEELDRVAERLLGAASLDEVFAHD